LEFPLELISPWEIKHLIQMQFRGFENKLKLPVELAAPRSKKETEIKMGADGGTPAPKSQTADHGKIECWSRRVRSSPAP
jgi:hypothetical protein